MVKILLCMCVTSWPLFSKKAKNSSIQHHFEVQFKITSLKEALKKDLKPQQMTDYFLIGWLMVLIVRIWTNLDQSLRSENNKKLKKNNNKSDSDGMEK